MLAFMKNARAPMVGVASAMAMVIAAWAASPASAACKNRGNLDVRYCDEDGDLVADTPKDPSKLLSPSTLVFSYTPVEDPSV